MARSDRDAEGGKRRRRSRRGRGDHRAFWLRQEHIPALPQRPGDVPGGSVTVDGLCVTARDPEPPSEPYSARSACGWAWCSRASTCSPSQRAGKRDRGAGLRTGHRAGTAESGGRLTGPGGNGRSPGRAARAAFRRAAAASRHRAGSGDGPPGDPLRRADQRAGSAHGRARSWR